jgi:hypothetical protein
LTKELKVLRVLAKTSVQPTCWQAFDKPNSLGGSHAFCFRRRCQATSLLALYYDWPRVKTLDLFKIAFR